MTTATIAPTQILSPTRAHAAQRQRTPTEALQGGTIGLVAGRDTAIEWHARSRCDITGTTIVGAYELGVRHVWCMNATVRGVSCRGPKNGFWAGSGFAHGWPDSRHHADSASNLVDYIQCVYNAPDDGGVAYETDGSSQNLYQGCVVQGSRCQTGWKIRTRQQGSLTELRRCWLEVVNGCQTCIDYDSEESEIIISGLRFHKTRAPEVMLDMSGAKNCRVTIEHNQWPLVPRIRLHRSCRDGLYVAENQRFTRKQFMDSVEWC